MRRPIMQDSVEGPKTTRHILHADLRPLVTLREPQKVAAALRSDARSYGAQGAAIWRGELAATLRALPLSALREPQKKARLGERAWGKEETCYSFGCYLFFFFAFFAAISIFPSFD